MRARYLSLVLLLAGCARPAPDHVPGVAPVGPLGGADDHFFAASPRATWLAVCRGDEGERRGVLLVAGRELPFSHIGAVDPSGRHVGQGTDEGTRVLDTWTGEATGLPGDADFDATGRKIAYTQGAGELRKIAVRDLDSGAEHTWATEDPPSSARFDPDGKYLAVRTLRVRERPSGESEPEHPCNPRRGGTEMGMMARPGTALIVLDRPDLPALQLFEQARDFLGFVDGAALLWDRKEGRLLRWTADGTTTLAEGGVEVVHDGLGRFGFVYRVGDGDAAPLFHHADGASRPLELRLQYDEPYNRPSPDAWEYGASPGMLRAEGHRWIHVERGRVVAADPDVVHAHATRDRIALIGTAVTIVDATSGEVLHRHELAAAPSIARGDRLILKRAAGPRIALDLARPAWSAELPGPVVALADDGHALVAEGDAGPFRWILPGGA